MTEATNTSRRCPLCGRPARHEVRPFCSRRCAQIDLGRWLRGDYRVPGEEPAGVGADPADNAEPADEP